MEKVKNKIFYFYHCKKCLKERPDEISPREWASLEFGVTKKGFQLWCVKHDENVLALDLLGQKVAYDE
tara:strand:- start:393 stop:596 length:204 start_codon:yes stop_codon:yes gene_type:complete